MPELYQSLKTFLSVALFFCLSQIGINAQTANFTSNVNSGCVPLMVNFFDQSSGSISSYYWDFGNGFTSTAANPQIPYSNTGLFTVKLTVTFTNGSTIDVIRYDYIRVFSKPTADFSTSTRKGCNPLPVNFTDKSTAGAAPINSWNWDYGNGVGSALQNPSFTYVAAGTYNITLIVTDTNNCSSSITRNAHITVDPRPDADFGSSNNLACKYPHQATMINVTIPNATGNTSYYWDFGNWQTSTNMSGSVTYQTPGSFDVMLVATNSLGCSDTMKKTNFVNVQDLKVNFSANKLSGCPPFISTFTNSSTPNLGTNQYSWSFGNGMTSSAQDTAVTYYLPGTFNVKLIVRTAAGCVDSLEKSAYITALNKPDAKIVVNDSAACKAPFSVQFVAQPAGATAYAWTFGDGPGSNIFNPYKTYNDTGIYSVNLIVTGSNGCNDTVKAPSLIKIRPPKAKFVYTPLEGCAPLTVSFSNGSQSVSPVSSILYKFRDGTTSSIGFPSKIYIDTGKFNPTLIVTTDDGCADSISLGPLKVGIQPTADFYTDTLEGCRHMYSPTFHNKTNLGAIKADKFEWTLGGSSAYVEHPNHTFHSEAKSYDVRLIAYNNGCADTMDRKKYVTVLEPSAKFDQFTGGCNSDSFFFIDKSSGGHKFNWIFGDGAFSTDTITWHTFAPGNYHVKLGVHDTITGCSDTADSYVLVTGGNGPSFRSDTTVCTQQGIWFIDQTPGSSGWQWDFGTGKTYSGRNVFLSFDEPGYYTVRYSAIVNGCRGTTIKKDYLHVYGPKIIHSTPNVPYCPPLELQITKKISSENTSIAYQSMAVYNSPVDSVKFVNGADTIPYYIPAATFPQSVNYKVFFRAIDHKGCQNWKWDTIVVSRPYSASLVEQQVSCEGSRYHFTGRTTDPTNIGAVNFRFDFGDGNFLDSSDAYHTYFNSGTYAAKFLVTDALGCTDTTYHNLAVTVKNLKAVLLPSDTFKVCPPFFVKFTDKSEDSYNGINDWQWTFGDGSRSSVQNPQKIFNYPGRFDISLKITDTAGCQDSVTMSGLIGIGGTIINYTIDTLFGCEPLSIKVNSTSNPPNADMRWDMGELKVVDSAVFSYTYNKAGSFIPQVFVSDNLCQYVYRIDDTVKVLKSPEADFSSNIACKGSPTVFTNASVHSPSDNIRFLWDFGDGAFDSTVTPQHLYASGGRYQVKLSATNILGCGLPMTKEVLVPFIDASLDIAKRGCANTPVKLEILSKGLGAVNIVKWQPGNGSSQNNNDSVHYYSYNRKGVYYASAFMANEYGCGDSVRPGNLIVIGDDFAPVTPEIHYATVTNNISTELKFKANSSVDFDKYILYRMNPAGGYDSIAEFLTYDDTSYTDPLLNTLPNTYTYKVRTRNFCGYYSDMGGTTPHTTMELKAFTADDASYLDWTPYAGWNVQRYNILRLDANGNFVKIKSVAGNLSEAYDSAIVCNTGYFYRIEAEGDVSLSQLSLSDSAGAIPNYLPWVPANSIEFVSLLNNDELEIHWDESVGGRVPVDHYIVEKSMDGNSFFGLRNTFDPKTFDTRDYVTNTGAQNYYYRVIVRDSCGYYSEPSNIGKTIVLSVTIDSLDLPQLHWNHYESWAGGVDRYEIEILRNGSFEVLTTVSGADSFFTDNISALNGLPEYCYRIVAYNTKFSSRSNIDCAPVASRVWVPSAFRPSGHPDNQKFYPKGMYLSEYTLEVYNRWGQMLFSTHDITDGWDGTYKGLPAPEGSYFYRIEGKGADGTVHSERGDFVLLR